MRDIVLCVRFEDLNRLLSQCAAKGGKKTVNARNLEELESGLVLSGCRSVVLNLDDFEEFQIINLIKRYEDFIFYGFGFKRESGAICPGNLKFFEAPREITNLVRELVAKN